MDINGIINIYKEEGYTSHDVVAIVKKLFKAKTGHTGTLDPNATGVLPICLGKATKLADYIMADTKGYKATLKLGITTDTQDIWGEVISTKDVNCSLEEITNVVKSFVGKQTQIPPMYSAIKINGKKLYELAREGKEIERKSREIEVYSIDILSFNGKDEITLDIVCSKGTYIRTICHDIGEKLGCGGSMVNLLRFKSGNFLVDNAIKISELREKVENGDLSFIMPMETVFANFTKIKAYENAQKYIENGNKININLTNLDEKNTKKAEKYVVYDFEGKLVGIFEIAGDFLKPVTMLR